MQFSAEHGFAIKATMIPGPQQLHSPTSGNAARSQGANDNAAAAAAERPIHPTTGYYQLDAWGNQIDPGYASDNWGNTIDPAYGHWIPDVPFPRLSFYPPSSPLSLFASLSISISISIYLSPPLSPTLPTPPPPAPPIRVVHLPRATSDVHVGRQCSGD